MKYWRRLFIVVVGFVESLLFSGCLFGWPNLLYVLQQEGVYSHLCNDSVSISTPTWGTFPSEETTTWTPTKIFLQVHDAGNLDGMTLPPEELLPAESVTGYDTFREVGEENGDKPLPKNNVTCKEQTVRMTLIYTVAAIAYGFTSVFIGFSLDILGLWFTRLGGCFMTSAGLFILAFTTKDTSWYLWLALNLIALGSSQLRLSSFQFANCWPQYRTTVLILYSSGYSVSTTLFLVVQMAYVGGISYKTGTLALAVVSLLTFPPTFLMPKFRIEDQEVETELQKKKAKMSAAGSLSSIADDATRLGNSGAAKDDVPRILKKRDDEDIINPFDEMEGLNEKKKAEEPVPLGTSLWTLSAALHLHWHFITFFVIFFYSATFLPWIQLTTDDRKTVERYTEVNGICALIAPLFIPLAGLLTDWKIRRAAGYPKREDRLAHTMQAPALTKAIATFFVVGTMICKVFFTPLAIYTSMILIAISRPFIVGSCASYIRIRFHPSHFNRLNGIFTTLVSLLTFVQFPILLWMKRSTHHFVTAQLVLILVLLLSFASPIHILITPLARKYAKRQLPFRTDI